MGSWSFLWFGEKDKVLIEEIAKLHKLDVAKVEKDYKKMIDCLKQETK